MDLNHLIGAPPTKTPKSRKENILKTNKIAKFIVGSTKSVEVKTKSKKKLEANQSADNVQKIPISINKRNIGFPVKDTNPLNSKIIPKA